MSAEVEAAVDPLQGKPGRAARSRSSQTLTELRLRVVQRLAEELSVLQELYLRCTYVTDAGLVHLKELKGLKILDLRWTKVTDAGVEALKRELPGCKIWD